MPNAIGRPLPRIDGVAKVTGTARYGADHPVDRPAHAFLATSFVARGRIASIDSSEARAQPGVLQVWTHENTGDLVVEVQSVAERGPMTFSKPPLASDEVFFAGQIVALVVAESFEAARDAAQRIVVRYERQPPTASFDSPGAAVVDAKGNGKTELHHGDAERAWNDAPVKLHQRYQTPGAAPQRDGAVPDDLRLGGRQPRHLGIQPEHAGVPARPGPPAGHPARAHPRALSLCRRRLRIARRTGALHRAGGECGARAQAARQARREPAAGLAQRSFRAETRHEVKLAAGHDGKLRALSHESWEITSRIDHFAVAGSDSTARLYACPNVSTKVHNVLADRQLPGFMRAPPELPYLFALESALDELAHALKMDPIELRRRNDARVDPIDGLPYSSRALMPCYDAGAQAFGWQRRRSTPGALRDGDWLVGYGCATAFYPANIGPADCRVTLLSADRARVEIGGVDIGNGSYTILTQVAAEGLGLQPQQVEVVLGDSSLPAAPITAGSNGAATTCNAVAKACADLRVKLRGQAAVSYPVSVDSSHIAAGVGGPGGGLDKVRQGDAVIGGGVMEKKLAFGFGAQFVEVRVHRLTGELRVPRLVGAFACGRIVNPLTARSQLRGGQIWGMSSALLEATDIDARQARYVNTDLAQYHVPVHADVLEVTSLMLPEQDTRINELGIKGVGEIGATGVNAALANAVFNATGVRVRELPIHLDKLIGKGLLA